MTIRNMATLAPPKMRDGDEHDEDGGFPVELLVPVSSARGHESPKAETVTHSSHDVDQCEKTFSSMRLYPQAVPLVQPGSSAVIRTIGAMLGNHQVAQRMLQRNTNQTGHVAQPSNCTDYSRRIQFTKVCESLFTSFDPVAQRSGTLPLYRMPLLLHHYHLDVDEVAYRQWEQILPAECKEISLLQFTQACDLWFKEEFLIDHWTAWRHNSNIRLPGISQLHQSQSAPQLLHPFDAVARQNDDALAFSYHDYSRSPQKLHGSSNEKVASKSHAMIKATQQLRRKTKLLTRLQSTTSLADTKSSNNHENTDPSPGGDWSSPAAAAATHDRLHGERLARHILQRCGTLTVLASPSPSPSVHQQRRAARAAKKLARLQSVETIKAFSASVAMISRHVHNEELRDQRELTYERQLAVVDERRQLRRLQHAHCEALSREKSQQQLRDVVAMKALAQEEQQLTRQYLFSRQQRLRRQKPAFELSASTSTLFPPPPEILAAKATAKTPAQLKKLHLLEKEHVAHMHTVQLLDYAYDKQRALDAAREPKADVSLLELAVDELPTEREQALAADELWTQLLTQSSRDLTPFIPPPNSPPAALRFFHPTRATDGSLLLPPFTASTTTPSFISKVPQH